MLKIKSDIKQQDFKIVYLYFCKKKLNNFYGLEGVDRVSYITNLLLIK